MKISKEDYILVVFPVETGVYPDGFSYTDGMEVWISKDFTHYVSPINWRLKDVDIFYKMDFSPKMSMKYIKYKDQLGTIIKNTPLALRMYGQVADHVDKKWIYLLKEGLEIE